MSKIQISKRMSDGMILVLGADTPEEFDDMLKVVSARLRGDR